MKRFAMLGRWHVHAPEYAAGIQSIPGCEVSKVWDPDAETAAAWAAELHCESASLEDILQDESIEGVVIGCATNQHTELLLKAAESGKAIFTEKVLTLTAEDADLVREAVLRNHNRFAISFPHLCDPATQYSLEAAKGGMLGDINYVRVRKAHNGALNNWLPPRFFDAEACGGGSMIDLGAHPMYLSCEILGMPVRVRSSFTQIFGKGVDDNAVSLLTFENGSVAVSETSYVSTHYPLTIEIGGTKGNLLQRSRTDVSICTAETGWEWKTPEILPERKLHPVAQWALADKPEDIPASFGIDAAVRLSKVMAMAYADARA